MQRHHITTTSRLGSVLFMTLWAGVVFGQASGQLTDFRGRSDYTVEELRQALAPAVESDVRPRGIGPASKPQVPPVNGATAVLNVLFASNSDRILPAYYADLAKLGQALT